ncbi:MAG TPA: PLP-dependent transferase, partial [Anaerolineaceae bacterium]|nr:PLP-dependent transferase [Anaerolineaceae bacterium]
MPHQKPGISTIVTHHAEETDDLGSHITPIYQTSAFRIPDAETGAELFQNQQQGYVYTRMRNPNQRQVVSKIAALEALDLPGDSSSTIDGQLFSSGMGAVSAAVLSCVKSGEKIITHQNLYGATYSFLHLLAEENKINIIWLEDGNVANWEDAFRKHPDAKIAYIETPSNPNLSLVDIRSVAEIAHQNNAWVLTDNTFASPYCQRPFNLGADVVLHSTTKYLRGHGSIIGGIV